MRLSHPNYLRLLIEDYKQKKADNKLLSFIARSTPANIREACLYVYKKRYDKKDDVALQEFFGPFESPKELLSAIEGFKAHRFKPLDNYLKGETEKTEDKNLELLAWLIDFQHRPYYYGKEIILNDSEQVFLAKMENDPAVGLSPGDEEIIIPGQKNEEPGSEKEEKNSGDMIVSEEKPMPPKARILNDILKKAAAILLIATISVGGIYLIGKQQKANPLSYEKTNENINNGCMYWSGYHYEKIPCNEKRKGTLIIPLDPDKMKNFQKISLEDTITSKSIGVVHYIKINGGIEYYTAGGIHPVEVTRNLHPLSPYMFEKYLSKQGIAKGVE